MIGRLIRKDFLLIRKYVIIMGIFAIVAPVLMLWKMSPENDFMKQFYGVLVFFLTLLIIVLLLSSSVSMVDETYKKGCAYLCTTPYGRNQMVWSKYAFTYLVFAFYCIIYGVTGIFFRQYTIKLTFEPVILSLVIISLFRCILIPLEYKFGYAKAKYIITILMVGIPFIIPVFFEHFDITTMDLSVLMHMDVRTRLSVVVGLIVINAVSISLSCYIFRKKDL